MPQGIQLSLKPGECAPAFTALDQSGEAVSSDSLRGRRTVLFFYPRDNTPGCTKEACSFRDSWERLKQAKIEVLGISPDGVGAHHKFDRKFELPFRLLADEDKIICRAFGVWGRKSFMGRTYDGVRRTTFLIGPDGRIDRIWERVKPAGHAEEILIALKATGRSHPLPA